MNVWPMIEAATENITDPGAVNELAVRRLVRRLRREQLAEIVTEHVIDMARSIVRGRNLNIERDAERRADTQRRQELVEKQRAELYLGRYTHGSMNKRTGAVPMGCHCSLCITVRAEQRELDLKYRAKLDGIMDDFVAQLRIEWTEELLAVSFAVDRSGATVTWGAATIEQHETRIAMLTANATSNIETAARHHHAVQELRSTGAVNLAELTRQQQEISA